MAPPHKDDLCLYQRVLGDLFDSLPDVLRKFHDLLGGTAAGVLDITRGDGVLQAVVAEFLQLPRAGKRVPVTVEVRVENGIETWLRVFGRRRLMTRQWLDGQFVVEAAGPVRLWFGVDASEAGLQFVSQRCTLLGIFLPKPLALRVTAKVTGTVDGWWVDVEVAAPVLGPLVRYEGEVVPN